MNSHTITRRALATSTIAAYLILLGQCRAATPIVTDADGLDVADVMIPAADRSIPGYRARPKGGSGEAVILVTQEIFGLHEHIRDLCRRLAKAGYYAIAPDLYVRQGDATKVADIDTLVKTIVAKVPDAQVMSDHDAAAAFAATEKADATKLGINGFCWGGRIVWLYAAHNPALKAGAAFYGKLTGTTDELHPKNPIDLVPQMKAPVAGFYGGLDKGITQESVTQMTDALKAVDNLSVITVYPDAGHGFNADYRDSYNEADAKDAWAKMLEWFKTHGVA